MIKLSNDDCDFHKSSYRIIAIDSMAAAAYCHVKSAVGEYFAILGVHNAWSPERVASIQHYRGWHFVYHIPSELRTRWIDMLKRMIPDDRYPDGLELALENKTEVSSSLSRSFTKEAEAMLIANSKAQAWEGVIDTTMTLFWNRRKIGRDAVLRQGIDVGSLKRVAMGRVVSTKALKTVIVSTETTRFHPKYGKLMRHWSRVAVHDEGLGAALGDLVLYVPCRRMSKTKSHRLVEIRERDTKSLLHQTDLCPEDRTQTSSQLAVAELSVKLPPPRDHHRISRDQRFQQ